MDANLKAKWLADLRSGNYEQANGFLRNANMNSYCCLGVLCITAGAQFTNWTDPNAEEDEGRYRNVPVLSGDNIADGGDQELSREFMRTIGLGEKEQADLIEMNDSGCSFSHIADYIEKNL